METRNVPRNVPTHGKTNSENGSVGGLVLVSHPSGVFLRDVETMRPRAIRQFRHSGVVKAKLDSTADELAEERAALRASAQEFLEVRQQIAERDEQIEDSRAEINDLLSQIREGLAAKQEAAAAAGASEYDGGDDAIAMLVEERLASLRELLPQ